MRRALLVVGYACQALLGLAVIALAAIAPTRVDDALEGEPAPRERAADSRSARSEARVSIPGPSLP